MNLRWHHRLIVRIGAGVLLVEIIALVLMGWWYTRAFDAQVDRERERRLAMPGTMMAKAFLNYDAVTDGPMWREMLGEEVVEAMIFNTAGQVNNSLRPERLNQNAFTIAHLRPDDLAQLPDSGRSFRLVENGEDFAAAVYPLKAAAGQAALFHLFLKVRTTAAEAQKRDVARRFAFGSVTTIGITTLVLVALYANLVGRGLRRVLEVTGQVKSGQMNARVPAEHWPTELGVLGRQVNTMLDAVQSRAREVGQVTRFQQAILDHAAYGIIATDAQGTITAFNRTAERMLGYSAAELIGRQTPGVFHDPAEVVQRAKEFSTQLGERIEPGFDTFVCRTRHGRPNEEEWTYVHKDGRRFPVQLGITALRDATGAIGGFLGIASDLSSRRKSEIELRRSRAQLEAAQRLARLGNWEFDLATQTVHWSQEMYDLYARNRELGPPSVADFYELIHPEDLELVRDLNRRAVSLSGTATCDYRTQPERGPVKYLSAQVYCLRDALEQPIGVAGTVQDITERKLAELTLRESEERSRLLISALAEGVTVLDQGGRIIASNQSAEKILGLTPDQLHGRTNFDPRWRTVYENGNPFPADDHPATRTLRTGLSLRSVVMGVHKPDGGLTWISINTAPLVRAGEAQPYAVVASFYDVTEQRAAVRAGQERTRLAELDAAVSRSLSGSKPLPETLVECMRQVTGFLDAALCQVWLMTPDHENLRLIATEGFGLNLEGPFANIPVGQLKVGKIAAEKRAVLANDLGSNPAWDVADWERQAGVTAFAGLPLIADGRLLGVFGVYGRQPISDEAATSLARLADRLSLGILRKQGEEQIQQLNAELEQRVAERTAELGRRITEVETLNRSMINLLEDLQQARDGAENSARQIEVANTRLRSVNEELEAFSYTVSHDLRAPLRNVSGFVELLRKKIEGTLESSTARYMKIIQDESQRMGQLIDDLLEFSRLGRAPLRGDKFSMSELVGQVFDELRQASPQAFEGHVGPLTDVGCDRSLVRQVWVNLLSNAVKYSRNSQPPRIEVGTAPPPPGGHEVVYFVRDNGVGFDMKYAGKLFGVFQRLHSTAEFEGTGIGLANVQRIVNRHGGRVWAESSVSQGATFYFALPVGAA